MIFSHVLYQLSYLGVPAAARTRPYRGASPSLSSPSSAGGPGWQTRINAALRKIARI